MKWTRTRASAKRDPSRTGKRFPKSWSINRPLLMVNYPIIHFVFNPHTFYIIHRTRSGQLLTTPIAHQILQKKMEIVICWRHRIEPVWFAKKIDTKALWTSKPLMLSNFWTVVEFYCFLGDPLQKPLKWTPKTANCSLGSQMNKSLVVRNPSTRASLLRRSLRF